MNVNIAGAIVAVRVGADNSRVARKISLTKLQAKGLRHFQGQTIVHSVPWVKADDIMVGLYITSLCVFAVLPVRQQAGHGEGVLSTFQRVQQIRLPEFGSAMLVQNGQAGILIVLEGAPRDQSSSSLYA